MTPEEGLERVKAIMGGEEVRLTADTVPKARLLLKELALKKRESAQVKRDSMAEMKAIRSQVVSAKASASAGLFATLSGKKAAGQDRARKKEQLRKQQEKELAPYERLNHAIDGFMAQIDRAKLSVETWIAENS